MEHVECLHQRDTTRNGVQQWHRQTATNSFSWTHKNSSGLEKSHLFLLSATLFSAMGSHGNSTSNLSTAPHGASPAIQTIWHYGTWTLCSLVVIFVGHSTAAANLPDRKKKFTSHFLLIDFSALDTAATFVTLGFWCVWKCVVGRRWPCLECRHGGSVHWYEGTTGGLCMSIGIRSDFLVSTVPTILGGLDERCRWAMPTTQFYGACFRLVSRQDFSGQWRSSEPVAADCHGVHYRGGQVRGGRRALSTNPRTFTAHQTGQCWTHVFVLSRRRITSPALLGLAATSRSGPPCHWLLFGKGRLLWKWPLARAGTHWKDSKICQEICRVLLQLDATRLYISTISSDPIGSGHFAGFPCRLATRAEMETRACPIDGIYRGCHSRHISSRVDLLWRAVSRAWIALHFASQYHWCYRSRLLNTYLYMHTCATHVIIWAL